MQPTGQRENCSPLVEPGRINHHIADMTATLSADVSLETVQRELAAHNQWLPIDGDPSRTIGELVSIDSSGPLRLGYGAWRDLLLGAQFYNGRDELITAGGRTVKNVAGYDLTKFMVGQHGVFGRLATVTTRTYRRPEGAILARFTGGDRAVARVQQLLPTPLRPQWIALTSEALLCGYLGDTTTLNWFESELHRLEPITIERRDVNADIDHRATLWRSIGEGMFRASVPPAKVWAFASHLPADQWSADPVFGVVCGPVVDVHSLEQRAQPEVSISYLLNGRFHFSTTPAERRIIERLKDAFDPDGKLAALPWQRT